MMRRFSPRRPNARAVQSIMVAQVRIFTIILLALFATSIVMNSAGGAPMSLKMAQTDTGIADMTDCQGCGADSDSKGIAPDCDIACTVSCAANFSQADTFSPCFAKPAILQSTKHLVGRTGPPEPYPPRVLI